jgi:homocysteine S-methyltransferase
MTFLRRIIERRPLLVDGATGTELNRRGINTDLPLWSARALLDAPEVLADIHADYVRAGAEVVTANTFRTHRRSLAASGLGDRAADLTRLAVEMARAGASRSQRHNDRQIYVAGSLAPLEDCYSPDKVPPQAECEREHAEMARDLADAGVDLILVETMNTIREAQAAVRAARATGLPVLASFVCRDDDRLFSGETVAEAVEAITPLGPVGILINCTPSTTIHRPFALLLEALAQNPAPPPISGLYANIGHTDEITGWTITADVEPLEYARLAIGWMGQGANLLGGCCGTTPAHIAALRAMLNKP